MTKYLSLFSGIGAFECAVKDDPRYECVGYSEVDPAALKVYRHWYPGHRSLGDVRQLTDARAKALNPDLIVAGFPCTDISRCKCIYTDAKARGLRAGGQSSLFVELVRIIQACVEANPKLDILVENVASMKRCHRVYITSVLRHVMPRPVHRNVICASHFSVQRRKRLFWTTWETKEDLSSTTTTKPPYFKDIPRNPDEYTYLYTGGAGKLNDLLRCTAPKVHRGATVTLPVVVRRDDGWYLEGTKEFRLGRNLQSRTRYLADFRAWSNACSKYRAITARGIRYKLKQYDKDNIHFKFRRLTASELCICFGFPRNYCDILSSYKAKLKCAGNSIVVGVVQHLLMQRSAAE